MARHRLGSSEAADPSASRSCSRLQGASAVSRRRRHGDSAEAADKSSAGTGQTRASRTATAAYGPTQTTSKFALMSAARGKADSLCSARAFPSVTHRRHTPYPAGRVPAGEGGRDAFNHSAPTAATKLAMLRIALRASGSIGTHNCQQCGMRGQTSSRLCGLLRFSFSAMRTASSRKISSLPT